MLSLCGSVLIKRYGSLVIGVCAGDGNLLLTGGCSADMTAV